MAVLIPDALHARLLAALEDGELREELASLRPSGNARRTLAFTIDEAFAPFFADAMSMASCRTLFHDHPEGNGAEFDRLEAEALAQVDPRLVAIFGSNGLVEGYSRLVQSEGPLRPEKEWGHTDIRGEDGTRFGLSFPDRASAQAACALMEEMRDRLKPLDDLEDPCPE